MYIACKTTCSPHTPHQLRKPNRVMAQYWELWWRTCTPEAELLLDCMVLSLKNTDSNNVPPSLGGARLSLHGSACCSHLDQSHHHHSTSSNSHQPTVASVTRGQCPLPQALGRGCTLPSPTIALSLLRSWGHHPSAHGIISPPLEKSYLAVRSSLNVPMESFPQSPRSGTIPLIPSIL